MSDHAPCVDFRMPILTLRDDKQGCSMAFAWFWESVATGMADAGWLPGPYSVSHCPAECSAPKPAMRCNGSNGGGIDCIMATIAYLLCAVRWPV